ncbi:hypothetical protein FACS189472_13690 [Alphaproteobacteria bacterium]|nr:hypothetical protein FACS189472_13690 [Alphaproteobacteria bacterium]
MAKKGYHHMTLEISSQIQVLKSIGLSQRKIAEKNTHKSVVRQQRNRKKFNGLRICGKNCR